MVKLLPSGPSTNPSTIKSRLRVVVAGVNFTVIPQVHADVPNLIFALTGRQAIQYQFADHSVIGVTLGHGLELGNGLLEGRDPDHEGVHGVGHVSSLH